MWEGGRAAALMEGAAGREGLKGLGGRVGLAGAMTGGAVRGAVV